MKAIFISLLFCLMINNANALSIIYDGFKCTDDSTSLGEPAQSIFTIEEDLGNGHYKLLLEGGYLVFPDGKICLNLIDTSIDPENIDGLSKIKAVAHLNGNVLVISYGLTTQNKDIVIGTPILLTDINFPNTYTLVFDYLPSSEAFKLKSVAKLGNFFQSRIFGDNTAQSFSLIQVDSILPTGDIQFFIKQ
ncbi:MAG: hypothetical protein ABTQ25_02045 [Nitrosomonas ureae]